MEMVCHCYLTDSIVSNLISNRKLTANDAHTFLISLIYLFVGHNCQSNDKSTVSE